MLKPDCRDDTFKCALCKLREQMSQKKLLKGISSAARPGSPSSRLRPGSPALAALFDNKFLAYHDGKCFNKSTFSLTTRQGRARHWAGCAGDGIGNGHAISIMLADEGCNVICLDRDITWATKTADMVNAVPNRGLAIATYGNVTLSGD